MKIIAYKAEEIEKGIYAFVEQEEEMNIDEIMFFRPIIKHSFIYSLEMDPFNFIKNYYKNLYRKLGLGEISDRILTLGYDSEITMVKFISKNFPQLLPFFVQYSSGHSDVFTLLDSLFKFAEDQKVRISFPPQLLNLPLLADILIPPFIKMAFKKDKADFEQDTFYQPRRYISHYRRGKHRPPQPPAQRNFNGSTLLSYTPNYENISFAVGKINRKKKEVKFITKIPVSRDIYGADGESFSEKYIYYNGHDYTFYSDIGETGDRDFNSIFLINFIILPFFNLQADYVIMPKEDEETEEAKWPGAPYMIFPWYAPVKRKDDQPEIFSSHLPKFANQDVYFPGEQLSIVPIKISKPLFFTKIVTT